MTVYWVGNETDTFDLANVANAIEDTTAFYINSTYARCSVHAANNNAAEFFATQPWGSNLTELWFHFHHGIFGGWAASRKFMEFVNGSGQVVFKLTTNSGSTGVQAAYWDGSTFQNVGSVGVTDGNSALDWDIFLKCGTSGEFSIFVGGSLITSGTFSDSDMNNVEEIRLYEGNNSTSTNSHWSECIVADSATIGWHLFAKPPTGNGANTAWAGAFGDVDEAVKNDSDFISGAANGDIETYTGAASTLTGFSVKAVVVAARVKRDTGGPQNMQMALRESSTDYFSSNVAALSVGFTARQAIFELDPATAAAWTPTAAGSSGLEFGVKAIT